MKGRKGMKGTFFPAVEDVFGRWRLPVVSNCRSTGLPVGWVTHLLGPQHRVSISSGRGVWVSAGGIICSGWFTQFPAPLGPKMATRRTTCQLLWGVVQHDTVRACRRSPGRGGRPRLFSSIAELNSPNFPNAIRIPIYTYPHININVQSVFQFTRNTPRL